MRLLSTLLATILVAMPHAATVVGTIARPDGSPYSGSVTFFALSTPLASGSAVVTGASITGTATDGAFSQSLKVGKYKVVAAGQQWYIGVPDTTNTYNMLSIVTDGLNNYIIPEPGGSSIPATSSSLGTVRTDTDTGTPVVYLAATVNTLLAAQTAALAATSNALTAVDSTKANAGANSNITSLLGLSTPLAVAQGGVGAATASGARTNLGAAASGANSDIRSMSGLTTPLSVVQGGTGSASAAAAREALGIIGELDPADFLGTIAATNQDLANPATSAGKWYGCSANGTLTGAYGYDLTVTPGMRVLSNGGTNWLAFPATPVTAGTVSESSMTAGYGAEIRGGLLTLDALSDQSYATNQVGNGASPFWQSQSSTFTSWGTCLDATNSPFDVATVFVRSWDTNNPISKVRVRFRQAGYDGPLLGDKLANISPQTDGSTQAVTLRFDSLISAGTSNLWMDVFTDNLCGIYRISPTNLAGIKARYSTSKTVINGADPSMSSEATSYYKHYAELGAVTTNTQFSASARTDMLSTVSGWGTSNAVIHASGSLTSPENLWSANAANIAEGLGIPAVTNWTRTGTGDAWKYESSVFTGWGGTLGQPGQFSYLRFYVRTWNGTYPIANVRTRLYLDDPSGTLLADRTNTISVTTNVITEIANVFSPPINPGTNTVWLQYWTDGYVGFRHVSESDGTAKTNLWTSTNTNGWDDVTPPSPIPGTVLYAYRIYADTGNRASGVGNLIQHANGEIVTPTNLWSANATAIGQAIGTTPTVTVLLPSTLYALEGREMNVYFDTVVFSEVGDKGLLRYDVTCTKGAQRERCWRYTPTSGDAGSVSFTLDVYAGDTTLVATRACTLVTRAITAGAGVTRKLLYVGDSTGNDPTPELVTLFTHNKTSPTPGGGSDVMGLTLAGTVSESLTDSVGTSRAVLHEARSGWSATTFTTTGSPFYIGGTVDFGAYLTANAITLASNDWVIVSLGINDVFSQTTDAGAATTINTCLTAIDLLATNIATAVPGVRIGVSLTIPPAASQDAFAASYDSGPTRWRYARNNQMLVKAMLAKTWGTTVYLIPLNAWVDPVAGYGTTTQVVHARTSATESAQNNGVHPSTGYWQIADALKTFLKGNE